MKAEHTTPTQAICSSRGPGGKVGGVGGGNGGDGGVGGGAGGLEANRIGAIVRFVDAGLR